MEKLVFISISFLYVAGVESNLLVILLQGGHVLPSLGELALLHALSNIPVDKSALGIHQIKLVVQPGKDYRGVISVCTK